MKQVLIERYKKRIPLIYRMIVMMIGFSLAVSGGISMIAYMNMITVGHEVQEYLSFVSKRPECYLLPVGIGVIWLSVYYPLHNNDDN